MILKIYHTEAPIPLLWYHWYSQPTADIESGLLTVEGFHFEVQRQSLYSELPSKCLMEFPTDRGSGSGRDEQD